MSRETTMAAPASKIFPYLNNSKLMDAWNPWTKVDQDAKISFSGPDEGEGARTNWDGGKQLGTGSATITASTKNVKVTTHLEYIKPFHMVQEATLAISPGATKGTSIVKWSVTGENNFIGRMMCFFVNVDKEVGGNFEKGLLALKQMVEKK